MLCSGKTEAYRHVISVLCPKYHEQLKEVGVTVNLLG